MSVVEKLIICFGNLWSKRSKHLEGFFLYCLFLITKYILKSGATPKISGWINILYPYINRNGTFVENPFLMPWKELTQMKGPEPDEFPNLISRFVTFRIFFVKKKLVFDLTDEASAPVEWNYNGTLLKLHFHAGIMGTIQDPDTGVLSSRIGWCVTYDPPQDPMIRITQLQQEISAIEKCGDNDYKTRSWLNRAKNECESLQKKIKH